MDEQSLVGPYGGVSCSAMKRNEETSCWRKEASHRKPHGVGVHLSAVSGTGKLVVTAEWCGQGLGGGENGGRGGLLMDMGFPFG